MACVELRRTPEHAGVIGVRHNVALIRAVVHALCIGIGSPEHEPAGIAAIPGYLQGVVPGTRDIVGLPDGTEALIGPQGIDVHAGVCGDDIEGRLIDVRFALQVQSATSDVRHAYQRLPEQLSLYGDVPVPGFGIAEVLALRCNHERDGARSVSAGIIDRAIGYTGVRLEWRISSEKDGIADSQARKEAPPASAKHRLSIQLIGDAKPRLDITPLNVRVMVRNPAEETVVQAGIGLGHPSMR